MRLTSGAGWPSVCGIMDETNPLVSNVIRTHVVPAFGRREDIAAALGVSYGAVRHWERIGYIPNAQDVWRCYQWLHAHGRAVPIPVLAGLEPWTNGEPAPKARKTRTKRKFRCIASRGAAGSESPVTPAAVRRRLVGTRVALKG